MPTLADILVQRRRFVKARRRHKPKAVKRQKYPRQGLLLLSKFGLDRWRGKSRLLREHLYPSLGGLLQQAALDESGGYRKDSVNDDIIRVFSGLQLLFARRYTDEAAEIAVTEAASRIDIHQSGEHQKQIKSALGVELIVPEPGVAVAVGGFITENLDLVKTLDGDDFAAFSSIVRRGISQGLRVGDIRAELEHRLQISKNRALFLAVDQTNKLFGKLTKLRQESVGVTEYTWDTSQDERVRPRHAELHGTRQAWKNPPVVDLKSGRKAHPGGDYRCRCQGLPVFPAELLAA